MEYVYAALLLHKAGKKVDEASINKVMEAAGIKPEPTRVKALVAALDGVNIEEVIKQAPVAVSVSAPSTGGEEKKEEAPKEEEKEEEKQEAAAEGLGALFG